MTVSQLCNLSHCNIQFCIFVEGRFEVVATYFVNIDRLEVEEGHNDFTFDTAVFSIDVGHLGEIVAYIRS